MDFRVQKVSARLKSNLKEKLSLDEVALSVNLSASRLRHLFKREFGLTPRQYQKSMRLKKAKDYLENSFLTVKEIMLKVGIRDLSHFVRDFKKAYGLPPAQYRKWFLSNNLTQDDLVAKTRAASIRL